MPVQLQVQSRIQFNGHPCIPGQRQQEEEAHEGVPLIQEVVAAVKAAIKVAIQVHLRQQVQEEPDQAEKDPLHQEEGKEEAVQRRGEPHPSRQEEEPVIQGLLPLHLQVFHSLHVLQIHGVHLTDPGKHFQS